MRFPPPPIVLDSQNVVFFIPKPGRKCGRPFPLCPELRCDRGLDHIGACHAAGTNPYYNVLWEVEGLTKKES